MTETPGRRSRAWLLSLGLAAIVWSSQSHAQEALRFVDDTFEDFAKGTLDASGQDLYISRDGTIRTIHRFDLNQDGFLDLIFNSTHDFTNFVPASLVSIAPGREIQQRPLAVEGSTRVVLDDLNRDGMVDAVFCPNDSGLQHTRRFVTILWGGEDGWSDRRSNGVLPVQGATAIVTADLNRDGWPDIVSLNGTRWLPGQPEGRIVRIYWGSADGFLLSRLRDIGVEGASDLAAGEFTGDDSRDVAILTGGASVRVLRAAASMDGGARLDTTAYSLPSRGASCLVAADVDGDQRADLVACTNGNQIIVVPGRSGGGWGAATRIDAFHASHIAVGDLDGDSHADLVVTAASLSSSSSELPGAAGASVQILWGGTQGFSTTRATALDVPRASASAIGDLDGDGHADLAVALSQGSETWAAESAIFFGTGDRRFVRGPHGVSTQGAVSVAIAPKEGTLPSRAVFCNSLEGSVGEHVPLFVYWGSATGFDPANRWEIPFRSGYEASAADLNADGYPDLVAMNSQHSGEAARSDPTAGANIFWGGAAGFDVNQRRTILRERLLGTSNVADLDRDGYLDLVLGAFDAPDKPDLLVIHYGSANGFDGSRRVTFPFPDRTTGSVIADFDKDSWLDIAFVSYIEDRVHILLGGPKGFDPARQSQMAVPAAISEETADLNADGFLDLIVSSYEDRVAGHHDTGLMIFWGSATGFRQSNAQWLPGSSPIGMAVADFDADGYLDLFAPHYLGELTREALPSYLYWGGPEGFSTRGRTILMADSAHDALAGDFDRDGRLDLAVSSHTRDGNHHTSSRVFYNDGHRFSRPRIVDLPTIGSHWMWDQDMGHIYNRRFEQTYESSPFTWARSADAGRLNVKADTPGGSTLLFDVRSSPTADGLRSQTWRKVERQEFPLQAGDRVLQYRATFKSDNGDRYPILDRVEIEISGGR